MSHLKISEMNVKIKQIKLNNFKGIKDLDVKFNTEGPTAIFGENGTGKTTIMDAFLWLLFDKDSNDRKQFGIKTLNPDGSPIHKLDHSVEGTLLVDGKKITLKKTYREKWEKKRGSAEAEFSGHETVYEWEGLPMTMKEYDAKISGIVEETTFKLVTNPIYFSSLKWQTQREMLFRMAGDITLESVAAGNKDLEALIAEMEGKTLDEYRRYIQAKKKRYKEELANILPRIDEVKRSMPEKQDWKALEKELKATDNAIIDTEGQIGDISKAFEKQYAKKAEIQEQIGKARMRLTEISQQVSQVAAEAKAERKAKMQELGLTLQILSREITTLENDARNADYSTTKWNTKVASLRQDWQTEAAKELVFSEDIFKCPCCHRPLDVEDVEEMRDAMTKAFNTEKAKKLQEISAEGKQAKINLDTNKQELERFTKQLEEKKAEKAKVMERLEALDNQQEPDTSDPATEARIAETEKLIAELQKQAETPIEGQDTNDLKEQKAALVLSRDHIREALSQREAIKKSQDRIKELECKEEAMAQAIAELEGIEYNISLFVRAYTDQVEQAVNSKFALVKFKLFDVQVNGQEVETCEITVDGVPYSDLNSAGKINAGLDLINALSRESDVYAPVFVDNSETILKPLEINSQLIKLIVAEGYDILTVK